MQRHRTALPLTQLSLGIASVLLLSQCVAVNRSPALTSQLTENENLYGGVAVTTGRFKRSHDIIGIIQMTQEGYRTTFFGDVNKKETNPAQVLRTIGRYAGRKGADGIQHFSLVMANPKSEEEKTADKVVTAIQIMAALSRGRVGEASGQMSKGETTRYFIKGELVRWRAEEAPVQVETPATGDTTQ